MRKIFTLLLIGLIALAGFLFWNFPKDHELIIIATNDLHSRFFDSSYVQPSTHPSSLSKVYQYVSDQRREHGKNNVLLLDIGDVLQGDNAAYYFSYKDTSGQAHLMSRIFNFMGYDAAIVGNHDIETGHAVYDRIQSELQLPYLAANALDTCGQPYFQEYATFHRGGLDIVVLGMTNPNIHKWLTPSLWSGIDFRPIQEGLQEKIDAIRKKENPDLFILAMHAGIGSPEEGDENPAYLLATQLQGVDAIFAAHDHRKFNETIGENQIQLLEGGSRAGHVAKLHVQYTRKQGKIENKTQSGELIKMDSLPSSAIYNERFDSDFQTVKSFTTRPVGFIQQPMYFEQALQGPSFYMNFIHTVQMTSTGAELSIAAPLNTHNIIEAGTINHNDLFLIYPFENQLYRIWMTGQELQAYLEQSYDAWINRQGPAYNYDSVAGLIYEVNQKAPKGKRVRILKQADGQAFDPQKQYSVAINSYRASGAGDLFQLTGLTANDLEKRISERLPEIRVLIDQYLQQHPQIDENTLEKEKIGYWRFIF